MARAESRQGRVELRAVEPDDIPIFYEHQLDPDATRMARFPARERDAFTAHWARILDNPTGFERTILYDGEVAGNIVVFDASGKREVGYWIGKQFWGKGIATAALRQVLAEVETRPLHAYVAAGNVGSIRVLEKCGFTIVGHESSADGDGVLLELR